MSDSIALLRRTLPAVLPRLRRFARTLERQPADADDLAQQAIERALAHAAQWRAPVEQGPEQLEAAVRSWMFGIMKNTWIDNRRAAQRHGRVFASVEGAEGADHAHSAQEDRLSIAGALQRLPEDQQLAVALVLVEGYSYQEAADLLHVPVGTLNSRVARGREALATMLDAAGGAA